MGSVYDELIRRGMVEQSTDEEKIKEMFERERVVFYTGFDATADSLHVGHFMQLAIMRMLQKAGHYPLVLIGGGTTMVGDPSGRTDMRSMMTNAVIDRNVECFKKQMAKFIDISDGKAEFVNNADWLRNLNYIEFLRDYGVYFSVNRMLAVEAFKRRMEQGGLTFFEFNYMVMQSYDFLHLFREKNCRLQLGGNDQWSNIIGGVELIRKADGKDAYGMTFKLLTTREGIKMGKTARGALWLDREKTPPYEFYQYWRNVADADVINCLKLLTEIPMEEIERLEQLEGEELNAAKELLAYDLTALVHSVNDAESAKKASRALFAGSGNIDGMPSTSVSAADLDGVGIEIIELLMKTGLAASKGDGRRLVEQGGISVDDEKIADIRAVIPSEKLRAGVVIKKGKKIFHRAVLE